MRLLALDAATEACSVALLQDQDILERYEESGRSASERLMEMVGEVLADGGVTLRDLDAVAASVGPGGFTGVRVTVSVAQGLAYGADLAAIGVGTLEALAGRVLTRENTALCCLDARMNEVYWATYRLGGDGLPVELTPPMVSPAEFVPPPPGGASGIGRGFAVYPGLVKLPGLALAAVDALALPRAGDVARLAALRLALGHGIDPAALQPLYVRDKVALTEAERAAARDARRMS